MIAHQASGPLVAIMLFAWLPLITVIFALLPPRRAVVACFIFAWLFLPVARYDIPMVPSYDKMSATSWGVLLATLVLDTSRFFKFRPKWPDALMLGFCLSTGISAITNGFGPYDAFAGMFDSMVVWGIPYFIGRLYFTDLGSLRELAFGVVIGGLLYVPLCLFEIRMSPQLHAMVYGYHQHSWLQTMRYGGWRPTVFMEHGLMVGMWMATSTIIAFWLWQRGGVKQIQGIPAYAFVGVLAITTVLVKSTGAIALVVIGVSTLWATKQAKHQWPLLCIGGFVMVYIALRSTGLWSGDMLVSTAELVFGQERTNSLAFRIDNEKVLSAHGRERFMFGWFGYGRNRVFDELGREVPTDSMWVITFGRTGALGLFTQFGILVAGATLLYRRVPPRMWEHPAVAPAVALSVVVAMWCVDCLFNYMYNPVFLLAVGGLIGMGRVQFRRPVRSPVNFGDPFASSLR